MLAKRNYKKNNNMVKRMMSVHQGLKFEFDDYGRIHNSTSLGTGVSSNDGVSSATSDISYTSTGNVQPTLFSPYAQKFSTNLKHNIPTQGFVDFKVGEKRSLTSQNCSDDDHHPSKVLRLGGSKYSPSD